MNQPATGRRLKAFFAPRPRPDHLWVRIHAGVRGTRLASHGEPLLRRGTLPNLLMTIGLIVVLTFISDLFLVLFGLALRQVRHEVLVLQRRDHKRGGQMRKVWLRAMRAHRSFNSLKRRVALIEQTWSEDLEIGEPQDGSATRPAGSDRTPR